MENNYFLKLFNINVNDKVEKKNGLTYLSWAYAWGEVKKLYPSTTYTIYENADGWNYFTDGTTAWVKTGVTVEGIEHIEYLPVMDNRNKSIPLASITSFDVNKAIQRSLTKACSRHGLGLYIYAGEDVKPTPKTAVKQNNAVESVENCDEPSKEQIAELESLGGNIQVVADYYKVPVFAVTSEQVQKLIDRKKKGNAKKEQANG